MKFTCIKPACSNTYESNETEAYYCPSCTAANKKLAAQVDAQVASRPKRSTVSAVQQYEAQLKNSAISAGGRAGIKVSI